MPKPLRPEISALDEALSDENSDEGRTWSGDGWAARVHKNEDDEGWAVAMTRDGDAEPALVSPWVMGRDKKNPKPLDASSFKALVKGASDVLLRHAASEKARLHKSLYVFLPGGISVRVDLDIAPDEDDPHATLSAYADGGEQLASVRVAPSFSLTSAKAKKWIESGYREP